MLWVLSAVIGLLVGAVGAWIIQASARKKDAALAEADLKVAQARAEMLEKNLEEQKESRKAEAETLRREYDEKLQKMVLTFKDSAAEILKEKSRDLSAVNSEQIKNILDPLGKKMEEFRQAVEDSKEKSLKNTASIEQQIRSMMEQTVSLGKQAGDLASALRSKNKLVGNWGEVVLLNLLEGMGLREGEDYVKQEAIRDVDGNSVLSDDGGRRLIPDVVLFLPENKAVVIDSKVSLEAYLNYVNAADEESRTQALAAHSRSVETHVKELAAKNYSKYIRSAGKDSLDYVVMFVPNEGAFQLYYQNLREKWHEAFDRGIIISGESNLFAMLKIIENTWVRVRQQKNTEEVMRLASELLDRVGKFANTFNDVGTVLDKAVSKFQDARKVLSGRQSIVVTARKLEGKGVQVRERLHSALSGTGEDVSTE
ncbi:MAG TPA: DNA recombination protein RmuC [Candidatus Coprenecus pullistercoris]|nr:DNA recombination protein RmuC [Candidatus Coprenecus pullistercoris]